MGGKILSQSFDMLSNTYTMNVRVLDGDSDTEHTVEFLRVSTVYFINDRSKSRKGMLEEIEDSYYLELTDINFMDYDVDTLLVSDVRPDFTERLQGSVNFYVEIWSKSLFLEAAEVRVGGQSFVIGDW